jgi:predicted nucleotidyltransferase
MRSAVSAEDGHVNRGRPSPAARVTVQSMDGEARTLDDVIRELDGGLRKLYGERHRGVVLYGSHARGEADEGSDVDLLLLLEGQVGREIATKDVRYHEEAFRGRRDKAPGAGAARRPEHRG